MLASYRPISVDKSATSIPGMLAFYWLSNLQANQANPFYYLDSAIPNPLYTGETQELLKIITFQMPQIGKTLAKKRKTISQQPTPYPSPDIKSNADEESTMSTVSTAVSEQVDDFSDLPREQWPLKAFCTVKPIHGESFQMRKRQKKHIPAIEPHSDDDNDAEIVEQMQIVDGKIVVTDSRAQNAKHVDEKDEYVNEKSFQKKSSRTGWTKQEAVKFYKLLSLMGTDFGLIAGALKNKTRIQVRNKYKIEERKNPVLMSLCLSRKEFINTSEFAKLCDCEEGDILKFKNVDIPVPEPYYKVLEQQQLEDPIEKKHTKKQARIKTKKQQDDEGLEVIGAVEYSSDESD